MLRCIWSLLQGLGDFLLHFWLNQGVDCLVALSLTAASSAHTPITGARQSLAVIELVPTWELMLRPPSSEI